MMTKKTTITNGLRPWRYLFGVIAAIVFIDGVFSPQVGTASLITLLVCTTLTGLLYLSRRIVFDENNIYRIFGKKERVIPFTSILSIKRSGAKINGTRMWKVTYLDALNVKKKFLFLEGVFQHGSTKAFIQKVKNVKPDVVVWMHPFFNHPPEKK